MGRKQDPHCIEGMKESERPLHRVIHLPVLLVSVGMTSEDTHFTISELLIF